MNSSIAITKLYISVKIIGIMVKTIMRFVEAGCAKNIEADHPFQSRMVNMNLHMLVYHVN